MKFVKHSWFIVLLTICFFQSGRSQCAIFPFFSAHYDCSNNTATTNFTVNGAAMPYTFTVVSSSNVTITTQVASSNTGSFTSVPVGNYVVYITAANNCTASTAYQVTVPFSSSSVVFTNTNVSCFGGSDGFSAATVNSSFFVVPFTFSWTTGSTSQTAGNLTAGTVYSVTITDSQGCKATNSVTVSEPLPIVSSLTNTHITCFGTSINSTISSTGGTSPFTYTVDGIPVVGNNATNLFAGTHTIITKDSKNCLQTNTTLFSQGLQPLITFSITKPSCPGKTDGAISSSVSVAPPAYTYTWQPSLSNISTLSNLPVGNYTLTVKDGNACVTKSVAIVLPAASLSITAITHPENCSAVDGAATLNVSGGNFPYNFFTQPIVGSHSSNTINLLPSGSYTTILTDANNCIDTLIYNIGNLSTVSLSILSSTPVLCYNQCTGAVQLSVQNGVTPLTYSASNTPTTSSSLITNLCSGFYVIKVIDAIGCPATTTINMPTPPVFSYSASAPASACYGRSVLLQASAFGGAGGYNYVWNPGNISGQVVNLVPNGTTVYSLNVFDANGCTLAPFQFTVNINPPISININTSNLGICPGTTAQITPTITGGDGNYSFNWEPGNLNSESIFVQNASIPFYTLSVNDGCGSPTSYKIIPINLFPVIVPFFSVSDTMGCEPFCTSFTNLTPRCTNVIWNYGDKPFELIGNTTNYCYHNAGIYNIRLTVNDSNNCKTSFTYSNVITVLSSPVADFKTDPDVITLNNAENVLIENLTKNGDTFNWRINGLFIGQTKDITYTFKDTGCNFIRLIAKNQNNCVDTVDKFVCVIEGFNFYMPNCITVNNDNLNDVLIPLGTGWKADNYVFEIYNRWGKRIFKTTDYLKGWDGKFDDSNDYPNDIYYWRVSITDNIDKSHELTGHVTLSK